MDSPYVLAETEDYAVVYKPPRMHSAPLQKKAGDTLTDWFTGGELMHRLDYETQGLVLFAKNKKSIEFFKAAQDNDEFIKEYSAVCTSSLPDKTFPPCPDISGNIIESLFRPYGPGRKLVRPVIADGKKHKEAASDKGSFYRTEIISRNGNLFTLRIKRGFRHQIRCHLCWAGCPIKNDPLYPSPSAPSKEFLALKAHALFFPDPNTSKQQEYHIPSFINL